MLFFFNRLLAALVLFSSVIAPVIAAPSDTSPITIKWRDPLRESPAMAKKLRLEAGAEVGTTQFLSPEAAATHRDLYILLATQRAEGGYDAVNMYDRGILSWGLMQWTSHVNRLQDALWYMKGRLLEKDRGELWADLFKAHGIDVQRRPGQEPAFHVLGGDGKWKPITGEENLRTLFRGTKQPGKYDRATAERWAKVFARAGRDRTVQALQNEWAIRLLRECLEEKVDAGWTVGDFTRSDLFADALIFAMWTNNPAASREHFRRAVRQARQVTGEADPAKWPQGVFPFLFEQVGLSSTFGTWKNRTALVASTIPAGKVGRQTAHVQLASRGWKMSALRSGVRSTPGRLWRREAAKPIPPVAKKAGAATKQATAQGTRPAPKKPAAVVKPAVATKKPLVKATIGQGPRPLSFPPNKQQGANNEQQQQPKSSAAVRNGGDDSRSVPLQRPESGAPDTPVLVGERGGAGRVSGQPAPPENGEPATHRLVQD